MKPFYSRIFPWPKLLLVFLFSSYATAQQSEIITKKSYILEFVNNDPNLPSEVKGGLINIFFKTYPKLVKDFNREATRRVKVVIDTTYEGVAFANNGRINISSKYLANRPNDLDLLTHEEMHIIQSYANGSAPSWLIEGIADYARYEYGVDNEVAGWSIPELTEEMNYDNSYRITARFLVWISQNHRKKFVKYMDSIIRSNVYDEYMWKKLTTLTLEELWSMYKLNPELK
jgi:hypothetical protein